MEPYNSAYGHGEQPAMPVRPSLIGRFDQELSRYDKLAGQLREKVVPISKSGPEKMPAGPRNDGPTTTLETLVLRFAELNDGLGRILASIEL